MKKIIRFILLIFVIGLLCSCSLVNKWGSNTVDKGASSGVSQNQQGTKTLKILQYKVEIIESLETLAREYEKLHPDVKIEIETAGGGVDYNGMLRSEFAAGDYPDIFNCGGYDELSIWIDELEDLSDQPWISRLSEGSIDPMLVDGKIYGMPYNLEGYGFIYNKDIFEKCGIFELPQTFEELEVIAQILKDNGYTPFCNAYQEWWVLGYHGFNTVIANQENPDAFIYGIMNGTIHLKDDIIANNWIDLIDFTLENGGEISLTTDYNTQITEFANERAAMIQQGNWTQVQISSINPDIRLGLMPIPVAEGINNKILVGVPNNWVIYKNSEVKDIAKDFLNWMVTSEIGMDYIVNKFKFIPAMSDIFFTDEQLGDLAVDIKKYKNQDKVLGWYWFKLPDGSGNEIGAYTQNYINGLLTKEQLFEKIEKLLKDMAQKKSPT